MNLQTNMDKFNKSRWIHVYFDAVKGLKRLTEVMKDDKTGSPACDRVACELVSKKLWAQRRLNW